MIVAVRKMMDKNMIQMYQNLHQFCVFILRTSNPLDLSNTVKCLSFVYEWTSAGCFHVRIWNKLHQLNLLSFPLTFVPHNTFYILLCGQEVVKGSMRLLE